MITPAPQAPGAAHFEPIPWAMILTLLSMDAVIAFDDLMGLVLPDRKAFVACLRALHLEMRRARQAGGPFHSTELVTSALHTGLGPELCAHLAWWGTCIFEQSTRDHLELQAWTMTLRHCRRDPALWAQLGFPAEISAEAHREFLRSIDTSAHDRRRSEVDARPLSDWDLHMYALNAFDDDSLAPSGPASYVQPTVMSHQGFRFWAWLLKRLSAEQQAELGAQATRLVLSSDRLRFLERLPPPSTLEVGL